MGISSALYSGVSGLNTNSQAMSVIGNNLANTNTLGFKSSRTVFSDLMSSTINGSGGASQVGRGVGMSVVDNVFSQGTFDSTESGLDLAIEGGSFFLLREPGMSTLTYSRAGAFRFNNEGYLVNPEGFRVQGRQFDANRDLIPGDPSDIQVSNLGLVAGDPTTEISFNTNLNASEEIIPLPAAGTDLDIADSTAYNYSVSSQVYDTLGNPHLITVYFNKTAVNEWHWSWSTVDANGVEIIGTDAGQIDFTAEGHISDTPFTPGPNSAASTPVTGSIPATAIDWGNGTTPQDIEIVFETTQFNSDSVVISQNQNGVPAGELVGVNVDEEGRVLASYANGEQEWIAHLSLGKFTNPNGLQLVGKNLYAATLASGNPRTGLPGPELGKVFTNSLEQSNVDMSAEFTRMIVTQRGFQANSKIIQTVDELLGELINLKR